MKSILYTLALAMLALLSSCSDDKTLQEVATNLTIDYPTNVKNLKVVAEKIQFVNLTSGEKTSVAHSGNIRLPEGLYDCVYSADVTYDNGDGAETATAKGHLTGKAENVSLTETSGSLRIETFLSAANDDFIFEEIFFSGTLRASGSKY